MIMNVPYRDDVNFFVDFFIHWEERKIGIFRYDLILDRSRLTDDSPFDYSEGFAATPQRAVASHYR